MKGKNFLRYLLVFLAFAACYAVFFYLNKASIEKEFLDAAAKVPGIRRFGMGTVARMQEIAGKWGMLAGVALGLLSWLVSLVLLGLLKLVRLARFALAHVIALVLVYGAWLVLAIELLYYENRYSAISIGIIFFVGRPLLFAAGAALAMAVLLFLLPALFGLFRKKSGQSPAKTVPGGTAPLAALLIAMTFLFSGCDWISGIETLACIMSDDPSHCYQDAAISSGEDENCEKVAVPAKFKDLGSNPPRDKCYLQIAENTGDYEVCKNIKGGPMSYTQAECITNIAVNADDLDGCKRLSGNDLGVCRESIALHATVDRLKEINEEVEAAKSRAGANPDDKEAQEELKKLLTKQSSLFEVAPDGVKGEFFKSSREEIMAEVDDEDVKSEIARQFVDARNKNPNLSLNEQLKKMEEIRDRQMTMKSLDEEASALMDQIKESAGAFASDTVDDIYGDDIEEYQKAMAEKGRKYLEEHGGERIKRGIENLEWMKEKYDKASEQYEAISEQIEKMKKVYDEVSEVYNKVDAINKLVAEGRIDVKKAKVLHGAVYLGKGLEYATEYIPVFGSTASKVSKEMMDATVRFATKRAERTTALDKCIDDPEHCDPDSITGY